MMSIGIMLFTTGGVRGQVNPDVALDTFNDVEQWLSDWETPDSYDPPEGAAGVWVAVRWSGRLLGEASNVPGAADEPLSARALPGAARLAMSRSELRFRGVGDAVEQAERIATLQSAPTALELQFAHTPVRVRAHDLASLLGRIRPGLDGILIRREGRRFVAFPGEMLANGQSPREALLAALVEMNLEVEDFLDLLMSGEIRVWRFEVDHLTQTERGDPPSFMFRGSRLVPESSLTIPRLRAFADQLVDHLRQRLWPGDEALGVLGGYRMDIDEFDPLVAAPEEQALTALALFRYSRLSGLSSDRRQDVRDLAGRILDELARIDEEVEIDPATRVESAAMIVLAIRECDESEAPLDEAVDELHDRSMETVRSAFDPSTGFTEGLGPSARAAAAWALQSQAAADWAWQSTAVDLQPSLLPWLAWAELDLAGPSGEIRAERAMRSLRERLWMRQVDYGGLIDVEPDLRGGIAFREDHPPDWNTTRPLVFLATMLGDARLTRESERTAQIVRIANSLRFVRQLSVREADRYHLANPEQALGGIRSAVWSSSMPAGASAMALLAVTEALESLSSIAPSPPEG